MHGADSPDLHRLPSLRSLTLPLAPKLCIYLFIYIYIYMFVCMYLYVYVYVI